MKKTIELALITLTMLVCSLSSAHASPITGGFSLASGANQSFVPVIGLTGATATLGTATALDFTTVIVNGVAKKTPGVNGAFTINSATGDFSSLVNTIGSIKDFTFKGAGSLNYPGVPMTAFETGILGLVVDLNSVAIEFQASNALGLTGTATFHLAGFDPTPGVFSFSATGATRSFSFSASESASAPVPEPGMLSLLGIGIVAIGVIARRRKK